MRLGRSITSDVEAFDELMHKARMVEATMTPYGYTQIELCSRIAKTLDIKLNRSPTVTGLLAIAITRLIGYELTSASLHSPLRSDGDPSHNRANA